MEETFELHMPSAKDLESLSQAPDQHDMSGKIKSLPRSKPSSQSALPYRSTKHDEDRLRNAVCADDYALARSLLLKGVDVNARDDRGRSSLHFAATKANSTMLNLLLEYHANVSIRDERQNMPLHLAACTNNIETVTALLRAGADARAKDGSGFTALSYAESHLRILTRRSASSGLNQEFRSKLIQIARLIREWHSSTGGDEEAIAGIDALSERLATSTSLLEDADQLQSLLGSLTISK